MEDTSHTGAVVGREVGSDAVIIGCGGGLLPASGFGMRTRTGVLDDARDKARDEDKPRGVRKRARAYDDAIQDGASSSRCRGSIVVPASRRLHWSASRNQSPGCLS